MIMKTLSGLIDNFLCALGFLTVLPSGTPKKFDAGKMVCFFPVVGIFIGLMLAGVDFIAAKLWSLSSASVIDLVFLIKITGALHLDGLGDTADGLYGNRTVEKSLEIMKDSRIGAMGLVMVVSVLFIKWAGLCDITSNRVLMLIIIPSYARGATLFGFYFLEYGRPDGTGKAFFEEKPGLSSFSGLALPVALSFIAGLRGIILNIVFFALIFIILKFYKKKMNCITGDMLGAMTELTEAVLFLTSAAGVNL